MTVREIERVLYCEAYVGTDPGMTPLERGTLLSEDAYYEAIEQYGADFDAGMGAEAVKALLRNMDVKTAAAMLHEELAASTSEPKTKKLSKRL